MMQLNTTHFTYQAIGGFVIYHEWSGRKATEGRKRPMPGRPHHQPTTMLSLDPLSIF